MTREHRALVHWSDEHVAHGLSTATESIDPAWFEHDTPGRDDGWSLACSYDTAPDLQGNPSSARVHFLLDERVGCLTHGCNVQHAGLGTGSGVLATSYWNWGLGTGGTMICSLAAMSTRGAA